MNKGGLSNFTKCKVVIEKTGGKERSENDDQSPGSSQINIDDIEIYIKETEDKESKTLEENKESNKELKTC